MAAKRKRARRSKAAEERAAARQTVAPSDAPGRRWTAGRVVDLASHIVIPLGFLVLVLCVHDFWTFYEFDPDEGNNVIKALMVSRGYELYSEIWNDQAPLFTYALTWWFGLFGATVNAGRVLVLVVSCVTVWAVYQTLRITWGHLHALAAVLLLTISPYYIVLSAAVMLGLPSLMLATVSLLALTVWYKRGGWIWLVLSAIAMSLSILTKAFTAFLVPIFGAGILVAAWWRDPGKRRPVRCLIPPAVWSVVFGLVAAVLVVVIMSPSEINQLIEPHADARTADQYQARGERYGIDYWLFGERGKDESKSEDVLALAAVGLLHVALRRRGLSFVPALWAGAAYLALRQHAPIWYHHMPLIFIPASVLGGIAVGEIVPAVWKARERTAQWVTIIRWILRGASLVCVIFVLMHVPKKIETSMKYGTMVQYAARDRYLTAVMEQYGPQSKWVFADRQMFAFRAGLLVPPELSVTSQKRMRSGHLTVAKVVEYFEKYEPEQIVFCGWRMHLTQEMGRYVLEHYDKIYEDEVYARVFIKKGIDDDPVPELEAAIAEAPDCPQAYSVLARWYARRGNIEKAIELYRRALEIDPGHAKSRVYLADTLIGLGRFKEGFEVYRRGLKRRGRDVRQHWHFLLSYAWRLATCTDEASRNGGLAEQMAVPVIKARMNQPGDLNILAAIYAEQGRFADAVRVAEQAVAKARQEGQNAMARQIQSRLDRYKANRPHREGGNAIIPRFR